MAKEIDYKKMVSEIIADILYPGDESKRDRYWYGSVIRWGRVEEDLHSIIH